MNKIRNKLLYTKDFALAEEVWISPRLVSFGIARYLLAWVLSHDSILHLLLFCIL